VYLIVSQVITVLLVSVDLINLKFCGATYMEDVRYFGEMAMVFQLMLLTLIITESVH